jgi:AcrR family transcriptional regulator
MWGCIGATGGIRNVCTHRVAEKLIDIVNELLQNERPIGFPRRERAGKPERAVKSGKKQEEVRKRGRPMDRKLSAVPSQRERQRVTTRNRLFDLCIEEFRRVGVEKTRIRDVVERAGVVAGTFYFHFPTKNHVLLELGNRCIAKVADQLPGSPGEPPELEDLLHTLAEATTVVEEELGDPELLQAAVSSFQHPPADVPLASTRLQAALRDCIAERVTSPDEGQLSADELSIVILTAFFGALLLGPEDPRDRAAQLHRTLGFFARALKNAD